MSYRILAFDNLVLPEEIGRSDLQDIGTGEAVPAIMTVPHGFYDHYGELVAPRQPQLVTKSGVLWGDDAIELQAVLDNLRTKIGVRGRLTILVEDDDTNLRWQWARLIQCSASRPADARSNWLPYTLQWQTLAQYWRGAIQAPAPWIWDDYSWIFGDGTAHMDDMGTRTTVGSSGSKAVVQHRGNIPAEDVIVVFWAGTTDVTSISYQCEQSRQWWDWQIAIPAGQALIIDSAIRSVYMQSQTEDITQVTGDSTRLEITLTAATQVQDGDTITVSGTTHYDGVYENAQGPNTTGQNNLVIVPGRFDSFQDGPGKLARLTDIYHDFRAANIPWPKLAPGTNEIDISYGGNGSGDATIMFGFHDHYA